MPSLPGHQVPGLGVAARRRQRARPAPRPSFPSPLPPSTLLCQVIEFPISVSPHADDVRVLLAASLAPPLLYVAASRYVVRPLLRWQRARARAALAARHAAEVGGR
eukprot:141965-Chlamydomonas_euryale.AAC.1